MKKYALYAIPLVAILGIGVGFAMDISRDAAANSAPQKVVSAPPKVGDMAPEIAETNPDGDTIKLSSLRGKIVLVDFWASWCGPCRSENKNLVKTYKRFQNAVFKNANEFTVYSVSLDGSESAWKKAIEKDKLTWEYHVSDLAHWESAPAATYGVTGIPMNFLLDETGKVVALNLRGKELDRELEKLQ